MMEKNTLIDQKFLKPGKPLMILGNDIKLNASLIKKSIRDWNFVQYDVFLEFMEDDIFGIKNFLRMEKTIPINRVLVINDIHKVNPLWIAPIIQIISESNRLMIIIGKSCSYLPIITRSFKIINNTLH